MKRAVTIISLTVIFIGFILGGVRLADLPPTYDGTQAPVSVYQLQQDPDSYDDSNAGGAAAAIIQENLAETRAVNNVTSIVFDFRGYDTMGESFIMILTISGVIVLLRKTREEKEQMRKEREENGKQ